MPPATFASSCGPSIEIVRIFHFQNIGFEVDDNLYTYVYDDPIAHADPSGTCLEDLCVGEVLAATAVVRAVAFVVSAVGAAAAADHAISSNSSGNNPQEAGSPKTDEKGGANSGNSNKGNGADKAPPPGKGKESGSYTNKHESGSTYDGKGGRARSQESGRRVERETGDKHVATDWTPARNSREAFKQEAGRLESHGGPESPSNYNRIESPGKTMTEEDAVPHD